MTELKTAIVLTNLGSPESPTPQDVRNYLKQFLNDRNVVDIAPWLWRGILHGLILPFYSKRSAEKYQKIWTEQGSPLITITRNLAQKLEQKILVENPESNIRVACAMRYGSPSFDHVFDELHQNNIKRLIVFPLYPQSAQSSTGSTLIHINELLKKYSFEQTKIIEPYYSDKNYTNVISETISSYFSKHGKPERLIVSFHGLPERAITKGDLYFEHCTKTVDHLKINFPDVDVAMCFQSRFGFAKWLQPYTYEYIKSLPNKGIQRIAVICPGFAVDCLETLEEINIYNRTHFMAAGGKQFDYIPALNDSVQHVNMIFSILNK